MGGVFCVSGVEFFVRSSARFIARRLDTFVPANRPRKIVFAQARSSSRMNYDSSDKLARSLLTYLSREETFVKPQNKLDSSRLDQARRYVEVAKPVGAGRRRRMPWVACRQPFRCNLPRAPHASGTADGQAHNDGR